MGKPDGKIPLSWPRYRWEDNIKMDLSNMECDTGDLIGLAQNREKCRGYVRAVMNLRVPKKPIS